MVFSKFIIYIVKQEICTVKVNLANNPYEVRVGSHILYSIGEELRKLQIKAGTRILVVSNPDVATPYSEIFIKSLSNAGYISKLLVINAGEEQKTTQSISLIHNASYEHQLERNSLIIALGGGVIGDMAGFAAATWLRGIPFIQVPTTLLAMVDASVGGKTGVNHPNGKNLIGAFHQPKLVLIDIDTLKTLPRREFSAGMAEVIKYGVIGDSGLFQKLEETKNLSDFELLGYETILEIIKKSVKAKAYIVEKDEKENGIRALLNYGHTFGHVIENLTGYGKWLHGEAVSIGMVAVGQLSIEKGLWSKQDASRQKELLLKADLPVKWPKLDHDSVIRSLQGDKKVKEGKLRFVLPKAIGEVFLSSKVEIREINNLMNKLEGI